MHSDGHNPDRAAPRGRRLSLLEGVKVLDLTRFLAGPFAGMILGDLGAEVIKVEQLTGDTTRGNPPYFFHGDSAYFLSTNRNKKSIALDLKSPSGQEVLRRMIVEADVILDNLRAPQRQALGLSFDQLSQVNPRIVSCSLTGFGSSGPYEDRPAYDIIVEALGGIMSLTGPAGGPSVRAGVPIGDITASFYGLIGTLAGLESRRRTGEGVHIDVGMLDCQVSLLSYLAQYYFTGGLVASHQGRAHVSIPTYNCFETSDGTEIVTAANTQEMWVSLCKVLGLDHLIDDPRFENRVVRLEHRDELVSLLSGEIKNRDLKSLYRDLLAAGVPAAPINRIDEALDDEQIWHREMVVSVEHRAGENFLTVASPIKSDNNAGGDYLSPPALGGHTRALLAELGYSEEEVEQLLANDVIRIAS